MNNRNGKILPWEEVPAIFALAWPTMLEQLMQTAVQYMDTAMVGALGTYATAAVGATTTVNWLIGSTISALGVGFLSYIARACGAGEQEKARQAASQAVLAVLFCGFLLRDLPWDSAPKYRFGCRWNLLSGIWLPGISLFCIRPCWPGRR